MYRERTVKPVKLLIIPSAAVMGRISIFSAFIFSFCFTRGDQRHLITDWAGLRVWHREDGKRADSSRNRKGYFTRLTWKCYPHSNDTFFAYGRENMVAREQRDFYCHYSFYVLHSPRHYHSPQYHALQSIQTADRRQSIDSITERRTSMNRQSSARHYKKFVPSLILILNCIQCLSHPSEADPILLAFVFAVYLAFIWIIPYVTSALLISAYSSVFGS